MNRRQLIIIGALIAIGVAAVLTGNAQQNSGERLGRRIDRAIDSLQQDIQKVRASVENMGVAGRVYARLHWDKALDGTSISVDVQNDGLAILRGTVPSDAAKTKAGQLAIDTVGVEHVENDLAVTRPPAR